MYLSDMDSEMKNSFQSDQIFEMMLFQFGQCFMSKVKVLVCCFLFVTQYSTTDKINNNGYVRFLIISPCVLYLYFVFSKSLAIKAVSTFEICVHILKNITSIKSRNYLVNHLSLTFFLLLFTFHWSYFILNILSTLLSHLLQGQIGSFIIRNH